MCSVMDSLLTMAGVLKCPVCGKYTSDYVGWDQDTDLCSECWDILAEAESLGGGNDNH